MADDTIVLYPSPGIGHLIAMVELGKLILEHQPSFSIIIFIIKPPFDTTSTDSYIDRISSTYPSIIFRQLPVVSPPSDSSTNFVIEELLWGVPRLLNSHVRDALTTISQNSKLRAFVVDFFCDSSVEISTSLDIPTYYFYTSGASALCVFLYFSVIHETITQNIKDVKTYIDVPGTPPIFSLDLPSIAFERDATVYKDFLNTSISMPKSNGIIVNTFEMLEPRAIKAIQDGLCVPNGSTAPIHCIGPLIAGSDRSHNSEQECLTWLDAQPIRSVVFLSFGSMGTFKAEQLKEMAIGLEKSGHRFLWVVRNPRTESTNAHPTLPTAEPELDSLFPEGFMERTKERGFIAKSWAPQVAVLRHEAVGGFVTHCGWNSTLEAITHGVPMVAWPLYAEQRMNRVFLVEEMKAALPLEESEDGFVTATELERRVREIMDSVSGRAIRDRVTALSDGAKAALEDGGSSYVAMAKLLHSWKDVRV